MVDVDDMKAVMDAHRKWMTEDGQHAIGVRSYDGIVKLLLEVLLELRKLNEFNERSKLPDA